MDGVMFRYGVDKGERDVVSFFRYLIGSRSFAGYRIVSYRIGDVVEDVLFCFV
jgi:hypothetical protein